MAENTTTYKAHAMMEDLKASLAVRLPSLAQVASNDGDANPCLLIGAAAAGATGAFIRIKPVGTLQKDIIGHDQMRFAPHVAQIAFEANKADGAEADINPWTTLLPLIGELALRGIKVEVYEEAHGTSPVVGSLVAAKFKASFEASVQYPLVSGQ